MIMTKTDLIKFEDDIAQCFNNKMIRAPIHLSNDNEDQLIEIFKEVNKDDWICCSWRSHYHCLLKGVPPDKVKADILDGRSIELCYKDYNVISSAIVGGNIPIALGLAFDIKTKNQSNKVWCFVGDMTACGGQFYEAREYAFNFDLPITFVIEDNGVSVKTDTKKTWRYIRHLYEPEDYVCGSVKRNAGGHKKIWYYKYDLNSKWQHAGTNIRIQF